MKPLTKKQKLFSDKYIETLNAAESARYAGYKPNSAKEIGAENLTKPNIKAYIEERLSYLNKSTIMSQEEVLEGISEIARNGIEEKNRLKAYELMGKRYTIFTDRTINEVKIENSPVDKIVESIDKLRNGS